MRVTRLALAALLALAACATPAEPSALNQIDPANFQTVIETAAENLQAPGALVLLQTPQGTFTAKVGTTELGTQSPPQTDTHFRIASNTKPMTAALIVLLAQDGKLTLDDPISAYVPEVPHGDNITLADLLLMRSGLYCYTSAPELSAQLDADPAKPWTRSRCWPSRSHIHRMHRPTANTSTATPTMRCSASSSRRSAPRLWPANSKIGCSGRSA